MGIKKNVLYSTILTVSGYIFPLLTFPYVSRVLGVENIGICNFYDSIVNYFVLFSMLGMANLGIREIAKAKINPKKLQETFLSLLSLNLITTIVSIIILIIVGNIVPKLSEHISLIYIGVAKVLANCLLIEWFYKGLEDFRYITIRTIIVRSLYVVSVFLFVKKPEDYIIYFGLTTGMFVVNAFVNVVNARQYLSLHVNLKFGKYLKPYVILGLYQILTSMYTTFNVVYLGFASNDIQVGYYSTAVKFYTIILSFYTAFTGVMLPRMSSLLSQNKLDEFQKYIIKSSDVLYIFSVPIIFISVVFSPIIINILAGAEYNGAIILMRIVMPLMLIIGLEQILVYQVLFPLNKDKYIFLNSIVGAAVGISLNLLLVGTYQSIGTALSWVCSELSVLLCAYILVKKSVKIGLDLKLCLKSLLTLIPCGIVLYIVNDIIDIQNFINAIIIIGCLCFYFAITSVYFLKVISPENIRDFIKK